MGEKKLSEEMREWYYHHGMNETQRELFVRWADTVEALEIRARLAEAREYIYVDGIKELRKKLAEAERGILKRREDVRTALFLFEGAMTYDGRAPMEGLLLGAYKNLKLRLRDGGDADG